MMRRALISWNSKRQSSVSRSSCESEYYSLREGRKKEVWLRLLLQELGHISAAPTVILIDNQGTFTLAKDMEFHIVQSKLIRNSTGFKKLLIKVYPCSNFFLPDLCLRIDLQNLFPQSSFSLL